MAQIKQNPNRKPNRNTKQGRSVLLQEAKLRKFNRDCIKTQIVQSEPQEVQLVKKLVWIILMFLFAIIVYSTRGTLGLIRWLNH